MEIKAHWDQLRSFFLLGKNFLSLQFCAIKLLTNWEQRTTFNKLLLFKNRTAGDVRTKQLVQNGRPHPVLNATTRTLAHTHTHTECPAREPLVQPLLWGCVVGFLMVTILVFSFEVFAPFAAPPPWCLCFCEFYFWLISVCPLWTQLWLFSLSWRKLKEKDRWEGAQWGL